MSTVIFVRTVKSFDNQFLKSTSHDDSLFAKFDDWSTRVDANLLDIVRRMQVLDDMTRGHDHKLQQMHPLHSTGMFSSRDVTQKSAGNVSDSTIGRIINIEERLSHLRQRVDAMEELNHEVGVLRDTLDCTKRDFTSKVSGLERALNGSSFQRLSDPGSFQPIPQPAAQGAGSSSLFATHRPTILTSQNRSFVGDAIGDNASK